mgnify:CR=1 FL=1
MSTDAIFLTETQLAERQQRSIKTIQADRLRGGGIPYVKFGRAVRYRMKDVEAWEDAHLVCSTSEVR